MARTANQILLNLIRDKKIKACNDRLKVLGSYLDLHLSVYLTAKQKVSMKFEDLQAEIEASLRISYDDRLRASASSKAITEKVVLQHAKDVARYESSLEEMSKLEAESEALNAQS